VAASGDGWPDEYHLAAARLYAMFDAVDDQFVAGELDDHVTWTADDHDDEEPDATVVVKPIIDSLASARISAVCEIGFQFNATTLLCGMRRILSKQSSHWHDKVFTTWYAIWRASEGRHRDNLRGECVAMWIRCSSACHVVAKILKCSKIYCQDVTTCNDKIVKCMGVTHFVNSS